MINATHWDKLCESDPGDVVRRSLARYHGSEGLYELDLLADSLVVDPARREVRWGSNVCPRAKPPGFHYWLVSVVYLLAAAERIPSRQWVTGESLPYGEFFFRGPHSLPVEETAQAFNDSPERFSAAASRLGGTPWAPGRNAFVLPALPKVPLVVQFWERDDEFAARAGFLFDRDTCEHLPIDAVFSLVSIAAKRLIESAKEI